MMDTPTKYGVSTLNRSIDIEGVPKSPYSLTKFAVLLECHSMGRVDLYCIVTRKLKSCVKDFNLRVTMYYLRNIY